MRFEWDEAKAEANLRKHGVSFELARRVFEDPFLMERLDTAFDYGEDRYVAVGVVDGFTFLAVVHTDRHDVTRIISARLATRRERVDYEEQKI